MKIIRLIASICLIFCLSAPVLASPTVPDDVEQRTISMDFKNVDIHILIKFISELTRKNFIVDSRLNFRVTAYSPSKLSIAEAYKAFESILLVNNYAIVPTQVENEYKIVTVVEARREGKFLKSGRHASKNMGEGMVTQIIPLENSSAPELAKLLTNLVDKNALVEVYAPTNTLIVTAPASNLARVLSIVREVDQSSYAPQMETFPLLHGDAKSIAASISKIMTTKIAELEKIGKKGMALVEADMRTNSVVALGDPTSLDTIGQMIDSLDIPTPKGKDDIHYLSLENADASDVAKILNELISKQVDKDGKTTKLSKDIKVVADKATNSLIITARPDEFTTLEGTIKKLDILRKQVYIEALIMEVSSDADYSFGVNWAVGGSGADTSVFGSANVGGGTIVLPTDSSKGVVGFPTGGSIGAVLSDALNIGSTKYSIQAIVSAVETNTDYKILATPQLLTLDNEKASVNVVDNIPFSKQTQTSNINADYSSQSLDYKDVGVKLEIVPHIGEKGTLRLEIKQEVSRVVSTMVSLSSTQNVIAPTTKKREVETVIQMQNNQTAVIAGLINEDETDGKGQVPGVGDIPLLGWLFKQKQESSNKTNLFIFITPRVISTYDESQALARVKQRAIHDVELGGNGQGLPKMLMTDPAKPIFIHPGKPDMVEEDLDS